MSICHRIKERITPARRREGEIINGHEAGGLLEILYVNNKEHVPLLSILKSHIYLLILCMSLILHCFSERLGKSHRQTLSTGISSNLGYLSHFFFLHTRCGSSAKERGRRADISRQGSMHLQEVRAVVV